MTLSEEQLDEYYSQLHHQDGMQDLIGPGKDASRTPKPKKLNLSEADYMEILRAKRAASAPRGGTNYADGTVFYKGKALGRCPAGTTRSGKTCVPGAGTTPMAPGYKTPDLGGLSRAQVQALSKARSTEDIIKAHKKSNKQ